MRIVLTVVLGAAILQDPAQPIWGTWRWVRSSGGMFGAIREADSTTAQTVTFTRDHVAIYRDRDSVTFQGNYHLYEGPSVFSTTSVWLMQVQGMKRIQFVERVTRDTLILRDNAYDGWTRLYVRE